MYTFFYYINIIIVSESSTCKLRIFILLRYNARDVIATYIIFIVHYRDYAHKLLENYCSPPAGFFYTKLYHISVGIILSVQYSYQIYYELHTYISRSVYHEQAATHNT